MRVQIFLSEKLKIEPRVTNGWQSYGKFNDRPGLSDENRINFALLVKL
jgi:hypothetical protein